MAEEPLSISTRPLYEPTTTSNPSSCNEYQNQVFSCSRFSWKYVKMYDQLQQPLILLLIMLNLNMGESSILKEMK